MTYHNTTSLTGPQLKDAVSKASKQEEAILLVFVSTRKKFTPWDIHGMMTRAGKNWPITSIRRGVTNLMRSGHLLKTCVTKPGELGRPETFYVINHTKHPTPSTAKQVGLWG